VGKVLTLDDSKAYDYLPYSDGEFDMINLTQILEPLSNEDVLAILAEVTRVLKPYGWVVVEKPSERIKRLFEFAGLEGGDGLFKFNHVRVKDVKRITPEFYDAGYFVFNGKFFKGADGTLTKWSYRNLTGEWTACKKLMKCLKEIFKPRCLVSVGEGRGTFVVYGRRVGINAWGFDYSRWACTHPYAEGKRYLFMADARCIPVKDGVSDLTFVNDVVEHIYVDELDAALKEVFRISSRYILFNIGGIVDERDVLMLSPGKDFPEKYEVLAAAGHVIFQTEEWWREKLFEAGEGEWL